MTIEQGIFSFWGSLRATPSFLCQGLQEPSAMNSKLPYISLNRPLFKLQALVLTAVNNLSEQGFEVFCRVKDNLGSSRLEHKVYPRCGKTPNVSQKRRHASAIKHSMVRSFEQRNVIVGPS